MSTPAAAQDTLDLPQFYQVFFDEAGENLADLEQLLIGLEVQQVEDETLHAIFRCAHSIKGGAATFGFADLASLTHAMETLLDGLRRHEIALTTPMVDTLLSAGDMLATMLRGYHGGGTGAADVDASGLIQTLAQLARPQGGAQGLPDAAALRQLELLAGPLTDLSVGDDLVELFAEVGGAGGLSAVPAPDGCPDFIRFRLETASSDGDLLDLCSFHVPRDKIQLSPWPDAVPAANAMVDAPPVPASAAGSGPGAPRKAGPAPAGAPAASASETIRVAVDKVDQLINLMGELVITQAMLAQRTQRLDGDSQQQLTTDLTALERTTRDLQDAVMSMRMIPMANVFNRFPRMLRELSARLGKQVELRTVGEATELDKSLIEKITDPLTHLVRNSVDHGIELPAERLAAGKPAHGTLTLTARHAGGSIRIEVRDDGRGLDRERILAKARANGMPLPATLSDSEVWQLVYAPGFSTAQEVTDVSGRGVGMDVVRRNILALGGSVELESTAGQGMCVSVCLPLTLAIMDGMSVAVRGELYVLPLSSVCESLRMRDTAIKPLAGQGSVVRVREDYLPILRLAEVFGVQGPEVDAGHQMLVVVESDGRRVALHVDQLVGQQQVVVKNLEANYRKVAGIAGATIMADGRVAFILDVSALVHMDCRTRVLSLDGSLVA